MRGAVPRGFPRGRLRRAYLGKDEGGARMNDVAATGNTRGLDEAR